MFPPGRLTVKTLHLSVTQVSSCVFITKIRNSVHIKKKIYFAVRKPVQMISSRINTILTIPVFGLLYIYTALGILVVIPLTYMNARRPVQMMMQVWAKSVFLVMFKRLHIQGKENLNKENKYILIANHGSLFDIIAIASFYPEISWFGHERLLKVPVFRRFLKMTDYIPYKEPTIGNTRRMLDQLMEKATNQSVAIFPEGTRTLDGKINPFYRGFIYLFRTRETGILPVTLNGFYDLKPKNRFYINFGSKLKVIIHKPISREELVNKNDDEIIETVKSVIESAYN
jgi:1-acyl-sn-glycerol-3-phosphate acyltransferase